MYCHGSFRNGNAANAPVWTRVDGTSAVSPSRFPSGIYVDPRNKNHAWVSYSGYNVNTPATPGHVFEVTWNGAAATFTDISYKVGVETPTIPFVGFGDGFLDWRQAAMDDVSRRDPKNVNNKISLEELQAAQAPSAVLPAIVPFNLMDAPGSLADIARKYSGGWVRTTVHQNLLLRWVRDETVSEVWEALRELGLGDRANVGGGGPQGAAHLGIEPRRPGPGRGNRRSGSRGRAPRGERSPRADRGQERQELSGGH